MSFLRSIKVRVWLRFEMVVVAMLAFTYVFLIALFPSFYSWMKTYEIEETFVKIRSNWTNENIVQIINEQAAEKKMYIEINLPKSNYSYSANKLGGSLSLAVLAKGGFIKSINESKNGKIYKNFRDDQ